MVSARMAGNEAVLPQVLAALGLVPVPEVERKAAATGLNVDQRLIAEAIEKAQDPAVSQWAKEFAAKHPPIEIPPGVDPRDYKVEPGLWRSQLLPYGVSIDQAIRDGTWG